MKSLKKILLIIQRSNGDVFLSTSLINELYKFYNSPQIDLLVNDDTIEVAKLLPNITSIYTFSYKQKKDNRVNQEIKLISSIFKNYDLSINLTSSDRSVIYSLLAGKKSISSIEYNNKKSWWKKILLNKYYFFDTSKHILLNNLQPLKLLKINHDNLQQSCDISDETLKIISEKLKNKGINSFVIFHPSAQYQYKIYPQNLRNELLTQLNGLGLPILVTGGNNKIDKDIKKQIPSLSNVYDFIGETTIEEYFALVYLSDAYIGMDTLNMHIAASLNKRIFAIFGPTNLRMWSPWSNQLKLSASHDKLIQSYGNVTIFQADMPCVACGKAGCDNNNGNSDCLDNIDPKTISKEVKNWLENKLDNVNVPIEIKTEHNPRKILLYIVYGDDQAYYDGAIFSYLTFMNWIEDDDRIEVVVLTEKPSKFLDYPINVFLMNEKQKNEWSLNGKYHFRIKNRGLAFIMDKLKLENSDKILFFDTDTYFHKSPLPLFDLIQPNQALFYLNEGLIYDRKRFSVYVKNLEGVKIEIDNEFYELSKKSALWGSLMVGITANMKPSLDWADKLMVNFFKIVPSHTIEPFALSESLLRYYKIVEGKKYVSLYSTSRKKEHAKNILASFFIKNKELNINDQMRLAQTVKIKRSIFKILIQRLQSVIYK